MSDARALQGKAAEAYRAGDLQGAMDALAAAAAADPKEPDYLRNLAEIARERGDREAARRWLERAGEVTAEAPSVARLNLMAAGWYDLGQRDRMLQAAAQALALDDSDIDSRGLVATALSRLPSVPAEHAHLLARALAEGWADPAVLAGIAAATLRSRWPPTRGALAGDPLLAALLASDPVRDELLERRLTEVRRAMLLEPASNAEAPLWAGLARQGFINEYAWAVTPEEQAAVDALADGERTQGALLRIAAYRSLESLPDAEALLDLATSGDLRAVIRQQVAEPREAAALAARIPALTPIVDDVSRQVREMYEANPYPRWVSVRPVTPTPLPNVFRRAFPRARMAPVPNGEAPEILVAGCGTGRHPIYTARAFAGSRLLAVDLSLASLGYAKRKARELGVETIEFALADVLELEGRSFDVIEAAGSLQCMDDPAAATRRLCAMLRPGGLFRFGLYSAQARRGLAAARAVGDAYPRTLEGIRAFRQAVFAAPVGSPVREALSYPDFYSTSMCRDLLLHVKEHVHTLPQIKQLLADNGLSVVGFVHPPEVLALYRERFPDDPAAANLDNWAALEAARPETFRGMYQFWAQKTP